MVNGARTYSKQRKRINLLAFYGDFDEGMAYLLGITKARGNFQKDMSGVHYSSTNFQLILKLQILYRSTHRIYFNLQNKEKYQNGKAQYSFYFVNKMILSDLKKRGHYSGIKGDSARLSSPFPNELPAHLMPHYIRGFLDGHCVIYSEKKNQTPVVKINYGSRDFLEKLAVELNKNTGVPTRIPKKHAVAKSYKIAFTGTDQIKKIFNYLYCSEDIGKLFIAKKFAKWLDVLKETKKSVPQIDLDLELKTLYLIHEICCKYEMEPEVFLNACFGDFLSYARVHKLIPESNLELNRQAKSFIANFKISEESNELDKLLATQIQAYDLK